MEQKDFVDLLKQELSEVEQEMVDNEHGIEEEAALAGRWYELDKLIEIFEGSE